MTVFPISKKNKQMLLMYFKQGF